MEIVDSLLPHARGERSSMSLEEYIERGLQHHLIGVDAAHLLLRGSFIGASNKKQLRQLTATDQPRRPSLTPAALRTADACLPVSDDEQFIVIKDDGSVLPIEVLVSAGSNIRYEPAIFPSITATEDTALIEINSPQLLPREFAVFIVGLEHPFTLRAQKLARYSLGFSMFDPAHAGGELSPFATKLQRVQAALGFTDILNDLQRWGEQKQTFTVVR